MKRLVEIWIDGRDLESVILEGDLRAWVGGWKRVVYERGGRVISYSKRCTEYEISKLRTLIAVSPYGSGYHIVQGL